MLQGMKDIYSGLLIFSFAGKKRRRGGGPVRTDDRAAPGHRREKIRPEEIVPVPNRRGGMILFWIILFYGIFSGIAVQNSLDAIGPDGVSYILLAEHYARGQWGLAVSGLWSPLLTWILVPLIRFGIDPLHGFHFIALIFGGGFIACVWLLSGRFRMSLPLRVLASASAAIMAVIFSVATVTPDLLLATLLLLYLYFTLDPDLPRRPYIALLCGIIAGIAYLSKAYAAPFFLVHFSVLAAFFAVSQRGSVSRNQWVRTWILGIAAFCLVAAPWVAVLSSKYGHFTFSTAGSFNHAIVAPGVELSGRHLMAEGIWPVPQGRLNIWEDPTELPYQDWSPFESWANFKHQTVISLQMAWYIFLILLQTDLLKLGLAALAATFVMAFRRSGVEADRMLYRWSLITIGVYLSGYLFVFSTEFRYYWPVCVILLLLVFHYADRLRDVLQTRPVSPRRPFRRSLVILAMLLPLVSFSINPVLTFIRWRSEAPREKIFRDLANDLAARGIRGPIGSNDWTWSIIISYHLREPYVGRAMSMGPDLVDQLRAVGTRTFLVWGPLKRMENFFRTNSVFHLAAQYEAERSGLPADLSIYQVGP